MAWQETSRAVRRCGKGVITVTEAIRDPERRNREPQDRDGVERRVRESLGCFKDVNDRYGHLAGDGLPEAEARPDHGGIESAIRELEELRQLLASNAAAVLGDCGDDGPDRIMAMVEDEIDAYSARLDAAGQPPGT